MAELTNPDGTINVTRRAGCCTVHRDFAWLYNDGTVECMWAKVMRPAAEEMGVPIPGDCAWAPTPPLWTSGTHLRPGDGFVRKPEAFGPLAWDVDSTLPPELEDRFVEEIAGWERASGEPDWPNNRPAVRLLAQRLVAIADGTAT